MSTREDIEEGYDEKTAARILGYAPRTIRAWRTSGLIEATYSPTGRVRYTAAQILAARSPKRGRHPKS